PAPGFTGSWSFTVKVQACEDVFDVTAQGGANGWAPVKSFVQSTGSVTQKTLNKNAVYLWSIGNMPLGDIETLRVTVGGSINKPAGESGTVKIINRHVTSDQR